MGLGSEGLREKQIEKAQKLLLTKLTSTDYNNQNNTTSVLMTPEQQRAIWTNIKTEARFSHQHSRQADHSGKALAANIKKVNSFQKMSHQNPNIML